jgi:TonB family protein
LLILGCGSNSRFRSPKVISDREIDYPLSAQLNRIEGEALVGVFVSDQGKPEEVTLLGSSGHDELDQAAVKFARTLTFKPALLDNKPISAWSRLLLRYRLTEVLFDEDRWLADVNNLHDQAKIENDSLKREAVYRKLYTNYVGLTNYLERNDNPEINDIIRQTLSAPVEERWQPFWDVIATAFPVFDDFLQRYPESILASNVREDLMRQLVETEYRIKIASLKSSRIARKSPELIEMLESRLNKLQENKEATTQSVHPE